MRDVVLAPGSRSAALAVLLHEADRTGLLRLHVRVDERTAGFLALGLAKGSHRPTAVVTTSGTAVANLHPAVLEAAHSGEPVIAISADRPAELRGAGANQASEHQANMFGAAVAAYDLAPGDEVGAAHAVDDAVRRNGPSHLNLQFHEPLLPDEVSLGSPDSTSNESAIAQPPHRAATSDAVTLMSGPRTVVVAGDDAGPPARLMAQAANWPLFAEPTSGARTGSHAMRTYRLLLGSALGDDIERVVVTGHPTLSRPVIALIARADIEVVSVRSRSGVCTDPGRVARHLDAIPRVDSAAAEEWVAAWRAADQRMSRRLDSLVAEGGEALPLQVAAEVGRAVP
ncbi:MAG: 2-succinyl-5-enolpyruvyl-6-hydroxy-3-cyclohexene-1-carboxylic-acid synthase, partial [Actinomycetota bacterium]|nr:2-succinyl-5-enolpyruvyl-6-hydroxy-3-cyclohexene-1-carboxylic-acid synthase [Actinomycetota bacterium]